MTNEMKEIVLVTGCCGFIGSNLVEGLLKRGYAVKGIDDLSTGDRKNIEGLDFEFVEGSITDKDLLSKILVGVDFVLHEAAIPSVPRSVADPLRSNEANVNGTLTLLNCAKEAGVKRVVFASSSSIYGDTPTLPKKEDMPVAPLSPYALTKYAGERYCQLFNSIYGLETIALRYFNVFGPKQNPDSQYSAVIPKFIKLMLAGQQPTIYGDGETSRDFSYIENVIHANVLAMKASSEACGKVFNIACGGRITLKELVSKINTMIGTEIAPLHADTRQGDVKHSHADITAAGEFLGYKPIISVDEGLRKTANWYKG